MCHGFIKIQNKYIKKPITPIIAIPKPDILTITLYSSFDGFFVTLKTRLHCVIKLLKRVNRVGFFQNPYKKIRKNEFIKFITCLKYNFD